MIKTGAVRPGYYFGSFPGCYTPGLNHQVHITNITVNEAFSI